MNKLKKIGLTALSASLVAISANAGEMSVSGSAKIATEGFTGENQNAGTTFSMGNQITFSTMPIHDGLHHDRLGRAAAQSGWSATDHRCAAFATREVKSIGKTDTAHLYWHREGNTLILTGQYISEGNNVLSRLYGRVAADANDNDINLAVSVFVGLVNASINDTKMVRLYNDANTLH